MMPTSAMLLDVTTFVGHLHPMLVHLPIGFLVMALLLEWTARFRKQDVLRVAVPFMLLAGFVAAAMAAFCGYVLAQSGDYGYNELSKHQWAGIGVAVASGVLWLTTKSFVKKILPIATNGFTVIITLLCSLVVYTGHLGGQLTHGADYLSLAQLTSHEMEPPASAEEAFLYEQVVHPILKQKCAGCHGTAKRKGKLSVLTLEDLKKGGKTGPACVAGKAEESELITRISLDPSNEKFMPADQKPALTRTEATIIRWWIAKGMTGEGKKLREINGSEEIKPQVTAWLEGSSTDEMQKPDGTSVKVNPAIPLTCDMKSVETLRAKGVMVRLMNHQPVMLDVTVPLSNAAVLAEFSAEWQAIGPHVVWLNLSGLNMDNGNLSVLKHFPNVEKLRLERNPFGDDIISLLQDLKHLEVVNLNETRITEAGLEKLKKTPSIRRVYHWKAGV